MFKPDNFEKEVGIDEVNTETESDGLLRSDQAYITQ